MKKYNYLYTILPFAISYIIYAQGISLLEIYKIGAPYPVYKWFIA